jgi:predicted ribosomally synthesized peptide with SipW-like signal peptide
MRSLLVSILVVAVVGCLAAGGGLFAHFSDSEVSQGNTFTAGTFDLKVDGKDNIIPAHVVDNMQPCCWEKSEDHMIQNVGDYTGELSIELILSDEWGGDNPEPEQEVEGGVMNNPDLAEYLDVIIVYCFEDDVLDVVQGAQTWEEAEQALLDYGVPAENIKAAGKLIDVVANEWPLDPEMLSGEESRFQLLVHVEQPDDPETPLNEANKLQGDGAMITKKFKLDYPEP